MSKSFVKTMRSAARLFQQIGRQLGVPRARRGQLAFVEKELARGHCTELQLSKRFQFGAYLPQAGGRMLARHWTRAPAARTRQRQMGLEGSSILFESQRSKNLANGVH